MKLKQISVSVISLLFVIFCIACNSSNTKPNQSIEPVVNVDSEIINLADLIIWPPKLDNDKNVNSFDRWLEKESGLSTPDISNMICFIRLMHIKKSPACYLVLTKPDILDSTILKDSIVLGNAFAWPNKYSNMSNTEFLVKVESEFLRYSRSCLTLDCNFYKASKVVVGFRNNDYKVLHFKKHK